MPMSKIRASAGTDTEAPLCGAVLLCTRMACGLLLGFSLAKFSGLCHMCWLIVTSAFILFVIAV
ncbi:hypothetical protein D3878_08350 [Noviherbaspirillum sedimenti]|uniref:Uncharacterized protein n=1 Tax=Noviherbaspirillum sedimenti TaxID=2320865 RepID=A0A3A3G0Z3_9BURK|nr:hypothetical protein D3878_08350 [Noviherbaspirillum sedimenti]